MLDIDLVTILAQVLNFLVIAAVLYYLLFKPMIKRMNERAAEKDGLLASIQEKERQAEETLTKIKHRLSDIDAEIEVRLEDVYQKAQEEKEALIEGDEPVGSVGDRLRIREAFRISRRAEAELREALFEKGLLNVLPVVVPSSKGLHFLEADNIRLHRGYRLGGWGSDEGCAEKNGDSD